MGEGCGFGSHALAEIAFCKRHSASTRLVYHCHRKALIISAGYQCGFSKTRTPRYNHLICIYPPILLQHIQTSAQSPSPCAQSCSIVLAGGVARPPKFEYFGIGHRLLSGSAIGVGGDISITGGHKSIAPRKHLLNGIITVGIVLIGIISAHIFLRPIGGNAFLFLVFEPGIGQTHLLVAQHGVIAVIIEHNNSRNRLADPPRINNQPIYIRSCIIRLEPHS